jgi:hypothetical protein
MKHLRYFLAFSLFAFFFFSLVYSVSAFDPTPVPVPAPQGAIGGTGTVGLPGTHDPTTEGPVALIANAYDFALAIGGLLAFGSILIGAVLYLAAPGNPENKSGARARITSAFIGLLLLLGIYAVLHIVNPSLTRLQFPTLQRLQAPTSSIPLASITPGVDPAKPAWACVPHGISTDQAKQDTSNISRCYSSQQACVGDTEGCPGAQNGGLKDCVPLDKGSYCPNAGSATSPPPGGIQGGYKGAAIPSGTLTDAAARSRLTINNSQSAYKISVNKADCTQKGQTDCTSLDGIPPVVIDDVIAIANACKCSFTITGGTEAGHKEHGMGQGKLDMVGTGNGLDRYILTAIGKSDKMQANTAAGINGSDGANYYWETNPDHWHVRFWAP